MNDTAHAEALDCLTPQAGAALQQALLHAGSFDEAMRCIEGLRQDTLGDGLLTVNQVEAPVGAGEPEVIDLRRVWSSRPDHYPVSGRKRKTLTPWTRQLLVRGEVFVGEGEAALAQVFDDHRLILSMGLQAVINVPLRGEDGVCRATLNVLGTLPHWSSGQRALVEFLASCATPHVLRHIARPDVS